MLNCLECLLMDHVDDVDERGKLVIEYVILDEDETATT